MNIIDAMDAFKASKTRKYSAVDRAIIEAVAGELELVQFRVEKDFITDVGDFLHVHPTMIVAAHPFKGAVDRGLDPYRRHRHFLALERWVDRQTSK
jgi:hypothetical protein